jgi:hydroxymethylbilane synthase
MGSVLRLGARRSPLARVQAALAADALRAADPAIAVVFRFIEAPGDRSDEPSAALVTARGGFTEDLGRLLDAGEIDVAVHSWKDLPLAERATTAVVATLPRADARDVLLVRRDALDRLASQPLRILSSSVRRRHHLEQFLAWALPVAPGAIRFESVRGDIGARLAKLLRGDGEALVIAKAAIDRLLAPAPRDADVGSTAALAALAGTQALVRDALATCRAMVLPLSACPASPAQGALALEVRRDSAWLGLLAGINDTDTFELVQAERARAFELADAEPLGITRQRFEFGDVEFVRGARDDVPFAATWLHRRGPALPRPSSREMIWTGEDDTHEARERVAFDAEPLHGDAHTGLLVARADAMPPGSTVADGTVLWTAGLATWRRLAERGFWVTGSDDSLGETGALAVRTWYPATSRWLKLSHEGGRETSFGRLVATYRTRRRHALAPIDRYSHFYWSSGTQLREYLAAFPGLARAWHGCGPGNTLQIARTLLDGDRVRPFLSAQQFRQELLA